MGAQQHEHAPFAAEKKSPTDGDTAAAHSSSKTVDERTMPTAAKNKLSMAGSGTNVPSVDDDGNAEP